MQASIFECAVFKSFCTDGQAFVGPSMTKSSEIFLIKKMDSNLKSYLVN